jgi:membrane associated rhomboid family serine protease
MQEGLFSILIFLGTGYTTWRGESHDAFKEQFLFSSRRILAGKEYYRLLSSGFLHGDWMHFTFNMISFHGFAQVIEIVYNPAVMLLIYLSSILGGNLLSLWLHKHHEYRALGASGGVCGMIFAALFLLPGVSVWFMPGWLFALIFLAASIFFLTKRGGNIGHDAHLGGALSGMLAATLINPAVVTAQPVFYFTTLLIFASLLCVLWKNPLLLPTNKVFAPASKEFRDRKKRQKKQQKALERELRMDDLLEKISREGLQSLTERERAFLDRASKDRRS